MISIIAQVIIEMSMLWLVNDYAISCYNHPHEVIIILKHLFSKWPSDAIS